MTPAARAQAVIEILSALENTAQPADRFLRDWFRQRRYAGSGDRAAVAERIYDIFRHRASYAWRMDSDHPRALVIASLMRGNADVSEIFNGARYAPALLTETEMSALANRPKEPPPLNVAGEFPDWLEPELTRSLGDQVLPELQAMLSRAPVDLRANRLKYSRDRLSAELTALGFDARATEFAPDGVRLNAGAGLNALQNTGLFKSGGFEFQDEGSQILACLVEPKSGERILDFAAGAGGKTLALAAAMQNTGVIDAYDAQLERMKPLPERASRAGANNIRIVTDPAALAQDYDAVLIDAPCSGSGTWRRNPDAKWRLTPQTLAKLHQVHAEILDSAARHVRPGGRLLYATCSLLKSENEDAVGAFLSRNRAFRHIAVETIWNRAFLVKVPRESSQDFHGSPFKTGTDGFFASMMQRVER
ncbi:MAG TPA: RsmB/NOP family class I SAM-dependent RNA methyltransferase [Micropepsaceae bacterium]|nr:RsmB/NOP family class I SAM-dependent RNA methyltransferase [Micropepsaceae bacterium]